MDRIQWELNRHINKGRVLPALGDPKVIQKVLSFHETLPGYKATSLYSLDALVKYLGISGLLVKDESTRFGLNSFKGLGSSYAVANHLNGQGSGMLSSFTELRERIKNAPKQTFATATAGNHGLGLAWSAKQFDQNAIIYMPKGTSKIKLDRVLNLGAKAEITDMTYDDTVRYVSRLAKDKGWIVIQDTSWDGYTITPTLIMQGYLTIVAELEKQIKQFGNENPTHIILQAGVGSFAGAIVDGLRQVMDSPPYFIIVEPSEADCYFQSACAGYGLPKQSKGSLLTIMAGLGCAELNPIAWNILKPTVDCFARCTDEIAAKGMRILGNPLGNDPKVVSGESGAVPLGLLVEICTDPHLKAFKQSVGLDSKSRVLFINTEGDTNPENYREICWDGKYAM